MAGIRVPGIHPLGTSRGGPQNRYRLSGEEIILLPVGIEFRSLTPYHIGLLNFFRFRIIRYDVYKIKLEISVITYLFSVTVASRTEILTLLKFHQRGTLLQKHVLVHQ